MQYFKPTEARFFVGDCMPFFHEGIFHLYYLLDEGHHSAQGGLGGHQWAHASSADLVNWTHHPLAIAITKDFEYSICTGSTFFHNGTYYGFYATRFADWTQHLALATSADGITFVKTEPNPLASPPKGYHPLHYRDPFVFWNEQTRRFHMLVTAMLENYPLYDLGGCLAHLTSTDLAHWDVQAPFLIPGYPGAPECSDYFFWNGWYYLLFSNGLIARYRMSRQPFGPWLRPTTDILDAPAMRVMKTAAFNGGRRIGIAWVGTRKNDSDSGPFQWGGHAVFREIIQHDDGTLGTRFPPEMTPIGAEQPLAPVPVSANAIVASQRVQLNASQGFEAARISGVPGSARITMKVNPGEGPVQFGLRVKASHNFDSGYDLCFYPIEKRVELFDQAITVVDGLDKPFRLDIVIKDDIIDVCIDQRRCLINRCPELHGAHLFFFARHAQVTFDNIVVSDSSVKH